MYPGCVSKRAEPIANLRRNALQNALAWTLLVGFAGATLGVSALVQPEALDSGRWVLTPQCPTKRLMGRDCPTCGMSRGFASIAHGRLRDAWRYNRASPVAFAGFLAALGFGAAGVIRSIRTSGPVSSRRDA